MRSTICSGWAAPRRCVRIIAKPIYRFCFTPIHGAHWLPPCLIIVGDQDPLIDDARALQARLEAVGVRHEMVIAAGMPHGFVQMEFFGDARRSIERIRTFLARELASSNRSEARRLWLRLQGVLRSKARAVRRRL